MAVHKKEGGILCLPKSVKKKNALLIRSRRRKTEASLYPVQDMTQKNPSKRTDEVNRTTFGAGQTLFCNARLCGLFLLFKDCIILLIAADGGFSYLQIIVALPF
jgi:hypothetical protein